MTKTHRNPQRMLLNCLSLFLDIPQRAPSDEIHFRPDNLRSLIQNYREYCDFESRHRIEWVWNDQLPDGTQEMAGSNEEFKDRLIATVYSQLDGRWKYEVILRAPTSAAVEMWEGSALNADEAMVLCEHIVNTFVSEKL